MQDPDFLLQLLNDKLLMPIRRKHIHHRLLEIGLSRTRTVLVLHAISMIFLAMAFALLCSKGTWMPTLVGVAALLLVVIGRSFSFSRYWFGIGKVIGNNRDVRKHTKYALTLSAWLELESERCATREEFWPCFTLMFEKLGFSKVLLKLDGHSTIWESPQAMRASSDCHTLRVPFPARNGSSIEFIADKSVIRRHLFDHLTEITAEACLKCLNRLALDVPSSLVAPPQKYVSVKMRSSSEVSEGTLVTS